MHRRIYIYLAFTAALAIVNGSFVAAAFAGGNGTGAAKPAAAAAKTPATANAAAPAADKQNLSYKGPEVLDPSRFYGLAAVGYASAKAAPEVMSHLFCYCGCDSTDDHKHLIDCFTSPHGVDCHICQEEAVAALKLYRQGVPMVQIQKQIDQEFAHHYPFTEETANYKAYKASRLWTDGSKTAGAHSDAAGPQPASKDGDGTKSATAPKVKPGFHVGNCCGGGDKKN